MFSLKVHYFGRFNATVAAPLCPSALLNGMLLLVSVLRHLCLIYLKIIIRLADITEVIVVFIHCGLHRHPSILRRRHEWMEYLPLEFNYLVRPLPDCCSCAEQR